MVAETVQTIRVGYEVGTGESVDVPLRHLAVTGQTQESGKTTTLEALVARSGVTALAFVTKRGESAFTEGRRVQPYFRDRADWQFVTSILDATLQEKNKFLRPWIIRICRTTHSLADVQREVRAALKTAKGIHEGVYTQLDAYLDLIVPEIRRADLAPSLDLRPGVNVMDVSGSATPMQMLYIQSALDWVNAHASNTVVIVPEAWQMIPEGKGSPVKASAVMLVRQGAGIGNFIWVDSQDMAGVDKVILRGCAVWLIGVQREANEIKRNLSNIPKDIKRPTAHAVATLDRGQFYVCWGKHSIKTYVQPVWMSASDARNVALGAPFPAIARPRVSVPKETTVTEKEARELREENERLRARLAALEGKLSARVEPPIQLVASTNPGMNPPLSTGTLTDELYGAIKARLVRDPQVLRVLALEPEIRVEKERVVADASASTLYGRLALLISEGFFDDAKTGSTAYSELRRRAFPCAKPGVYRECDKLALQGFLTKEASGYEAVPSMKANIAEGAVR